MKIKAQDFNHQVKNNLKPIYLLSGDETVLINEAYDCLRETAKLAGYNEHIRFTVDQHFDWQAFLGESQHLSLFATQRILDIDIPNGKPGDAGSKALQRYCEDLPQDTILIIRTPKLASATLTSRWVKALDAIGAIVIFYPLEKQLPQWLAKRAKEKGLTLSNESIQWIAQQSENNALAASQEIEKLYLQFGAEKISHETVVNTTSNHSRYDNFKLMDAAYKKEKHLLIHILSSLRLSGEHPTLILWTLSRELRTLAELAFQIERGASFTQICQRYGIWPSRQSLIQQTLAGKTATFFQQALLQCHKIDKMIKGQEVGNCWDAFLDVLLRISSSRTQAS